MHAGNRRRSPKKVASLKRQQNKVRNLWLHEPDADGSAPKIKFRTYVTRWLGYENLKLTELELVP
jgi:hypothetical protein